MFRACKNIGGCLCLSLIFILSAALPANAQELLILNDEQGKYLLGAYLEVLEDPQKQWTLEDVSSAEFGGRFVSNQVEVPGFGFTSSAYWVRFQLRNESREILRWLLELKYAVMHSIDLYLAPADCQPVTEQCLILEQHGGARLPFAARDFEHRDFIFRLPLAIGQSYTVYLRVENSDALIVPLTLWNPEMHVQQNQTEQVILGMFYGILLIMGGYNLFLFFFLGDRSIGAYVLFIFMYLLYQAADDGVTTQYLWPNQLWLSYRAVILFACMTLVSALLFARTFLQTKTYVPKLYYALTGLLLLATLFIPLIFLLDIRSLFEPLVFLALISIPLMLTAGVFSWRRGYHPARYFLLGWSVFFVAIFARMLSSLAYLPSHVFFLYGDRTGAALMMLLLSFALADQIRAITREKEAVRAESLQLKEDLNGALQKANEELECRVSAQNTELERAQQEILMLGEVMNGADQLSHASADLSLISSLIAEEAEKTSQRVMQVSSNSQQISQSVHEVSISTENVATNIQEISKTVGRVSKIIERAVEAAGTAKSTITDLEAHSQEIGEIVKLITNIAQQTNLLALNAAIEAARAGEVGNGFKVVANEIKELARETAGSAEDISHKVETMQAGSKEARETISEMVDIIEQVAKFSLTISSAISFQTEGTNQISTTIADIALGSDEITDAISEISITAQDFSERASYVQEEAQDLASLGERLHQLVEQARAGQAEDYTKVVGDI